MSGFCQSPSPYPHYLFFSFQEESNISLFFKRILKYTVKLNLIDLSFMLMMVHLLSVKIPNIEKQIIEISTIILCRCSQYKPILIVFTYKLQQLEWTLLMRGIIKYLHLVLML